MPHNNEVSSQATYTCETKFFKLQHSFPTALKLSARGNQFTYSRFGNFEWNEGFVRSFPCTITEESHNGFDDSSRRLEMKTVMFILVGLNVPASPPTFFLNGSWTHSSCRHALYIFMNHTTFPMYHSTRLGNATTWRAKIMWLSRYVPQSGNFRMFSLIHENNFSEAVRWVTEGFVVY